MILHFVDDHIAASSFLMGFEQIFPQKNIILKLCKDGKTELSTSGLSIMYPCVKDAFKSIDYSQIKVIDVQLLRPYKIKAIVKYIPSNIPIVWWTYGGDLYNYFLLKRGYELYSQETLRYVEIHKEKSFMLWCKNMLYDKIYLGYLDRKVLNRVVGIIPCVLPDYEQACKWLKKEFDLVDITPWQDILDYPLTQGKNVMVGHSASMTNNHLYALERIKAIDLGDSKISLPLSYNIQSEVYFNEVMRCYKEWFENKVEFMLEMMDIDDYKRNFLDYKVAIFPCWRQEALGNIFTCLQLGLRVVLSQKNPCYNYLLKLGFVVSALEQMTDYNPLSEEEQQQNRLLFIKLKNERDKIVPKNLKQYFSKYI